MQLLSAVILVLFVFSSDVQASLYANLLELKKICDAELLQSQMAMITIGSDETSGTHPGKSLRLKAIEAGWNKAMAIKTGQTTGSANKIDLSRMTTENAVQRPTEEIVTLEILVTEFCVIDGASVLITDTDALLSYAMDYLQIGERVAPIYEACYFDLVTEGGRYCVVETGEIYFDTEQAVGKCEPCDEELCGGL